MHTISIRSTLRRPAHAVLFLAIAASSATAQQTFTVPLGSSIQTVINGAGSGDTILLLTGTYNEQIDFQGKAITIQGAGRTLTFIDGNGVLGPMVSFVGNETRASVLRDLTVTRGVNSIEGGGVRVVDASPTLVNCTVSDCHSSTQGGGVYVTNGGPRLQNCLLTGNGAPSGAGMHVHEPFTSAPALEAIDTRFIDNSSSSNGGGLAIRGSQTSSGSPWFDRCEFAGNDAALGGGVYVYGIVTPSFERCVLDDNTALNTGGGAYWRACAAPSFVDCAFERNAATDGGAIGYLLTGSSVVKHCTLSQNSATLRGGGIFGTQEPSECEADPAFRNCLVVENTADVGGGAYFNVTNPLLTFCTFSKNLATSSVGGIFAENAGSPGTCTSIEVRNSILWGNTGLAAGSALPWSKELWAEPCAAVVKSSDIEGSSISPSSTWIASNLLDSLPHFVVGYSCKTSPVADCFLSQSPLQPQPWSRCLNAAPGQASTSIIAGRTTRTDGLADSGRPDLGFHYPSICP